MASGCNLLRGRGLIRVYPYCDNNMQPILYRLFLSVALISGASACTKDAAVPAPEFFMKANKDGKAWLVPAEATYVPKRGELYLFGRQDDQTTQSFLRLGFEVDSGKPLAAAVQAPATLPAIPATWVVVFGGDVLTDGYTQASVPAPQLHVTRLDTVQKIVEGTFEATLLRDARWSSQAEALRFTDGTFRVRYQQN